MRCASSLDELLEASPEEARVREQLARAHAEMDRGDIQIGQSIEETAHMRQDRALGSIEHDGVDGAGQGIGIVHINLHYLVFRKLVSKKSGIC